MGDVNEDAVRAAAWAIGGTYWRTALDDARAALAAAAEHQPMTLDVIHLSDPEHGPSFCGEPVTLIEAAGDTRPVCQSCHRGAMKTLRAGWCPCVSGRPQDCSPENWPLSARHGIARSVPEVREHIAREIEAFGEDSGIGAYGDYGPPAIAVSDAADIARGGADDD